MIGLNGTLLALAGLAILLVQVVDRPALALEVSVRRYAQAITNDDLDGAMAQIAPDQRDQWREFVSTQVGNLYEVRGIAVRAPSLLAAPSEVTVNLDVNRDVPSDFFQPTARVLVEEYNGAWYLAAPLLGS